MSVVYGTYGVDYVGGREVVCGGYFGGAGGAAFEGTAFAEKRRAGGSVNGTILDGGIR